jgi:hypothetical protein
MGKQSIKLAHGLLLTALCAAALSASSPFLLAQEGEPVPGAPNTTPLNPSGPLVTLRGVVLNAATGQPLPRALVRTSTPVLGALTDSDGRFEIAGVPSGMQAIEVTKPGFEDPAESDDAPNVAPHMVAVAAEMPEVTFQLAPKNVIYGHVTLSTDAPAVGIGVNLLRKTIEDGRARWTRIDTHQATPSGGFRFSGLRDGTYLIQTEPEFENGDAGVDCNADGPEETPGYAARFLSDTQELASAARIDVAGGQDTEATLALNLSQLHLVTAGPLRMPGIGSWSFIHELYDQNGQALDYPVREAQDFTLCVYLPDGTYTLAMTAMKEFQGPDNDVVPSRAAESNLLSGLVQFSVDGHAVRRLRVPLAQDAGTQVHVRFEPGPPKPVAENNQPEDHSGFVPGDDALTLSAERVNAILPQEQGGAEAERMNENTYVLRAASPGAYWIHAGASRPGTCIGTATAGGEDLSRKPWTVDANGVGAPIDVVVRTDCGKLTVELPAATESAGENQPIFVYAIPEVDSMGGILQAGAAEPQLGENKVEIPNVTPGAYRVFAFHAQRSIEFRNPEALERLGAGQEVTVEANGNASIAVQVANE